jgi:hypothetical protein
MFPDFSLILLLTGMKRHDTILNSGGCTSIIRQKVCYFFACYYPIGGNTFKV